MSCKRMRVMNKISLTLILIALIALVQYCYGNSECSKKYLGDGLMVCVCNSTYCDSVPPNTKPGANQINLYQSSKDGDRLNKSVVNFENKANSKTILTIHSNVTYQSIIGFGGAFTDAASINIQSLPEKAKEKLLQSYFSPDGIEYTVGRIPMASCDFSTHPYSYDDNPLDFNLTKFSLAMEDIKYKIPVIQKAVSMSARNISIFGSPWSAPAWMKTNNNMTGNGSLIGKPGGQYFKTWANYFVKFIQAYESHNISIWGLTAQNEPTDGRIYKFPFQAMGWTAEMQRDFIINDLGPALHSNGYKDVKLMIMDDQRFILPDWSSTILSNENASQYVAGSAVHWYTDKIFPPNILTDVHNKFPDKFIFATEACYGDLPWEKHVYLGNWERGEAYSHYIIQVLDNPKASKYISGIGIHWYYDFITPASILDKVQAQFPNQFLLATEACIGSMPWEEHVILGSWNRAEKYCHSIIEDLNHWVAGWTDWNIALDMQGGPNWVSNFVDSPIIVNSKLGEFYKQPMFYALGHFSKFIVPGSKRVNIEIQGLTSLETVAFVREDNSIVLVVLNRKEEEKTFSVNDPRLGYINTVISAHSIQTYIWWMS